jgi:hypothetical protein
MRLTRKEFLTTGTKYAAGAVIGAVAVEGLTNKVLARTNASWPYPYQALDPEKVRILGHDLYYVGGCSYAAFAALVTAMKDLVGAEPWTSFPMEIMSYGSGGGAGWGGTCGAINGSAAFISLVTSGSAASALESEVYGWYTQTLFPTDISNEYGRESKYTDNRYTQDLTQNMSGSILCHASVAEWCAVAQVGQSSTERKERCARLAGDVAAYTAKILNDNLASQFTALFVSPPIIAECKTCHGTTISAKMECTQCHGDHRVAGKVETLDGGAKEYELTNNYPNPFNPQTKIEFAIPKESTVDVAVYDVHGRLIRNLVASERHSAGRYAVEWDGTDNAGGKVASGVYFCRMVAGQFMTTKKMTLLK